MYRTYGYQSSPKEINEVEDFYQLNNENKMFKINWVNVKGALVSGLLTAVLGMAGYIIGVGDIFKVDVKTLANIGALSALTAIVSLLKNFLTTDAGKFAGVVEVVPDK